MADFPVQLLPNQFFNYGRFLDSGEYYLALAFPNLKQAKKKQGKKELSAVSEILIFKTSTNELLQTFPLNIHGISGLNFNFSIFPAPTRNTWLMITIGRHGGLAIWELKKEEEDFHLNNIGYIADTGSSTWAVDSQETDEGYDIFIGDEDGYSTLYSLSTHFLEAEEE